MTCRRDAHRDAATTRIVRLLCLLCASIPALILTLGMGTASASARCASREATSAMSSRVQPGCWRPFADSSPFNTPLPVNPKLASDNAAIRQHMQAYNWTFQGSATNFSFTDTGTRPVYFATPSDPTLTIDCTDEEGPNTCQGTNGINVNGAHINVPAGAAPGDNWDAHMTIIETATGQEYDLWHASITATTLTAGTGSVENVNTSNGTQDAGDAASFALTAGLLRPSELASGHINHALVLDIPCTNATGANTGYNYPAAGGWGQYCGQYWNESSTGAPPIGQLFKLNMTDTQIANSGAPPWEQTIMTALAHYGAYAEDTMGSWHNDTIYIFSQDPTSWTSIGQPNPWTSAITQLGGHNNTLTSPIPIPTSNLQAIAPCVPQGTCPTFSPHARRAAARAATAGRHARRHTKPASRRHRHKSHRRVAPKR